MVREQRQGELIVSKYDDSEMKVLSIVYYVGYEEEGGSN